MPSEVWDEITYPFPNFNGIERLNRNREFIVKNTYAWYQWSHLQDQDDAISAKNL